MVKNEPEAWVVPSKHANRLLYSELETLLRALDRFFSIENPPGGKSFHSELYAARDVILRVLSILETVIPEEKKNEYWLRKYAESKLLSDMRRDLFREQIYRQDSPEKALFLLYDSFLNLKTIVTDLLKNKNISYMSFVNIGQVISTHIRENAFFNPFGQVLNPELDTIENGEISSTVRNIRDKGTKKAVSVVLLHLFRFLRYLSHLDLNTRRYVSLHSSLLILLLIKSETDLFLLYLEQIERKIRVKSLQNLFMSTSYQFSMEAKRVYMQELKDIFDKKPSQMIGRIENSHGILKNLTEQCVIQIAQFWRQKIKGENIFDSFVTKSEISLTLRDDIYVLDRFLEMFTLNGRFPEKTKPLLNAIIHYMKYFESFTFRLLRHDDYEEFVSFFEEIGKAQKDGEDLDKTVEKCKHFKIYLDATLGHISNRAELIDRPLDVARANETIQKYLRKEEADG